MSSPAADPPYAPIYRQEFERLRAEFDANGSGAATVRDRTEMVDKLASQLWNQHVSPSSGFALVALGGFGRPRCFLIPTSTFSSCPKTKRCATA